MKSEVKSEVKSVTKNEIEKRPAPMSPQAFAVLGGGKIAYVKAIRSEEVQNLFPEAPALQPGLRLFALHAADGTPILIAESREAAVVNAHTHELETLSVH